MDWIGCRQSFFLPVRVLSRLFRNKFLFYLKQAFRQGKLQFHGEMAELAKPASFQVLCQQVGGVEWVVYAKAPFGGPAQVLKYLARYTHRVAISNRRLVALEHGKVTFAWKDYAGGSCSKTMTLEAVEFIRRFLLHILPTGFVRIRQFGFLANRARAKKLSLCRALLAVKQVHKETSKDLSSPGPDPKKCPVCQSGYLHRVEIVLPVANNTPQRLWRQDSS